MPPKILVISGPTASGKTRLAVELALRHGGEVVSADSMQVYRRMDIGTAKPTPEEMRGIPHHMLDVADPEEDFSVARYVELAAPCVDDILARGKLPIVAGGTGLYLDSLLSGRTFAPFSPDGGLRARLEARFDALGGEAMLGELAAADPEAASTPTTASASSGPWRSFSRPERPSPSITGRPGPSRSGTMPSPSPWPFSAGRTCGRASTGGWTR